MWEVRKGPHQYPTPLHPCKAMVPWCLGQVPVATCSPLKPEINSLSAGVGTTSSYANDRFLSANPGSGKELGFQDCLQ